MADEKDSGPGNFVAELVAQDRRDGKHGGRVVTRFPPEPNGYLHIGHAKSICLNFGLARDAGGVCNLRFDDTNPAAEDVEYVDSIKEDVRWLGFDWGDREYFASDYFERLFEFAERLIDAGKAYVDAQSEAEIRAGRGDFHHPGVDSPHRDRSVEENLSLFREMRAGKLDEGSHVLRAKIDMQSKDLKLRDPLMYRIRKVPHHRTGEAWPIYPMYDFAHGQSDAIEGVTHSVCTLEFENHRGLYDWFLEALEFDPRPRQIEFARLNLSYTVLSKRKLQALVEGGHVTGWDDPRMPTLAGMRRRGYPPQVIRRFCDRIGVAKKNGLVDVGLLEHVLREDLNDRLPRAMAVLRPLRLVIDNFEEDRVEEVEAPVHPEKPELGTRTLPLSRVVYVERDDFMKEPVKKWWRLAPGREVRLRSGCLVTCNDFVEDPESGEVTELHCTWDPDSLGGNAPDGRKVRGTVHWVSASHAIPAEVRLYDRLFQVENPLAGDSDVTEHLNPDSVEILTDCMLEASLAGVRAGAAYQFERLGYFCIDTKDSSADRPVFNRTIALRDSWAKLAKRG